MSEALENKKTFASKLTNWTSIVLMSLQVCATIVTIIYLAMNDRYKQLPWKIILQMVLFLLTPPKCIDVCSWTKTDKQAGRGKKENISRI